MSNDHPPKWVLVLFLFVLAWTIITGKERTES